MGRFRTRLGAPGPALPFHSAKPRPGRQFRRGRAWRLVTAKPPPLSGTRKGAGSLPPPIPNLAWLLHFTGKRPEGSVLRLIMMFLRCVYASRMALWVSRPMPEIL